MVDGREVQGQQIKDVLGHEGRNVSEKPGGSMNTLVAPVSGDLWSQNPLAEP